MNKPKNRISAYHNLPENEWIAGEVQPWCPKCGANREMPLMRKPSFIEWLAKQIAEETREQFIKELSEEEQEVLVTRGAERLRERLKVVQSGQEVEVDNVYMLQLKCSDESRWRIGSDKMKDLQKALETYTLRNAENEVTRWRILNIRTLHTVISDEGVK